MKQESIRQKMTAFAALMISAALVVFIALGGALTLFSAYQRFSDTKKRIEAALLDKGMTLVFNNSLALRGMAEDNAFGGIREIVASTVNNDSTMVYGMYMDTVRQPWVWATHAHPEGSIQERRTLDDPVSRWAQNLNYASFLRTNGEDGLPPHIAFAAPVAGEDGQKFGSIRYGIATKTMEEAIMELRRQTIVQGALLGSVFIVIAGFMFIAGRRFIARHTNAITHPIEELTRAAADISHGNYSKPVLPVSKDEIGELAGNFDIMRQTVKRYTEELETMVAKRTEQLEAAQKEIVDKAHKAGMADVATGTLHNVGNLLNSVRTSIEAIDDALRCDPLSGLSRANELFRSHEADLDRFLTHDPQGGKLLRYFDKIESSIRNLHETFGRDIERTIEKVNDIGAVIAAQQSYAAQGGLTEKISPVDLVEDALTIHAGALDRAGITVLRHYEQLPRINVQKSKLMHALFNVIKNAREAMEGGSPGGARTLTVSLRRDAGGDVRITICDTGCGVPPENLKRIFSFGYTTKPDGHGFGLHSSVNYIKEMGGRMWAESGGADQGASLIITFPLDQGGTRFPENNGIMA
ncbi:MAG: HAMP domain-containing protein [Chitinispirillaceae bacterium]|nr:HAMP domain-containing protein [Chitinispirillaceae bacterium]